VFLEAQIPVQKNNTAKGYLYVFENDKFLFFGSADFELDKKTKKQKLKTTNCKDMYCSQTVPTYSLLYDRFEQNNAMFYTKDILNHNLAANPKHQSRLYSFDKSISKEFVRYDFSTLFFPYTKENDFNTVSGPTIGSCQIFVFGDWVNCYEPKLKQNIIVENQNFYLKTTLHTKIYGIDFWTHETYALSF